MSSYSTEWSSSYNLNAHTNSTHSFKLRPNSIFDRFVSDVLYLL